MKTTTFENQKIKPCPFCAETIQLRAVKCRFCNEFLNTPKAKALAKDSEADFDDEYDELEDGKLFAGRPSLFGMVGTMLKAGIFFAIAVILLEYPAQNWIRSAMESSGYALSDAQYYAIIDYKKTFAAGLMALVAMILLYKFVKLKMTYYEVTSERIEWSRGILDRRVDNIDMFRVVDLRLRKSLLDLLFGIGTVVLITTDKSDPEFAFQKVRHCRELYDVIKNASLEADRKNSVVHLE